MKRQLFEAIYAHFAGSQLETLTGSRLFLHEVPQGASQPSVVYQLVSAVPTYTGNTALETVVIQFTIYSESSSAIEALELYAAMVALYDDCRLSVSGHRFVGMERRLDLLRRDVEEGVWQYTVEYQVVIETE